jgi:hypothetical protein
MDEELNQINTQRLNLLQKSNDEKGLIRASQLFHARIHSPPMEVLCRIFQFYIPVSAGHDMETPACAAPVILGQVCKYGGMSPGATEAFGVDSASILVLILAPS